MPEFTGNDVADVIVAAHWIDLLGSSPDDSESDFFAAGGSPRAAGELARRLQDSCGTPFTAAMVAEARTVGAIGSLVRRTGFSLQRMVPMSTPADGVPLVMMPSGSGTVLAYHHFGGDFLGRPVHGVQARGLNPADGPPLDKFDALMDDFVCVLEKNLDVRRIHIGGFCWGAIFAYEVARRLSSAGWDIVSVTLLNPSLEARPPSAQEIVRNRLAALAKTVSTGEDLKAVTDPVARELVDRAAATDEEKEVFGPRFHVFAMLWRAVLGYRPATLDVDLPIRLYLTSDLKLAGLWPELGLRDFQQFVVPGTFSEILFDRPSLARIRTQLYELEQAQGR